MVSAFVAPAPRGAANSYQAIRRQRNARKSLAAHVPTAPVIPTVDVPAGSPMSTAQETDITGTDPVVPPSTMPAPVSSTRRLRWTPYSLATEVKLIKAVANSLCGDYQTAGSFDGTWRDIVWSEVRVRRGDCVGLGDGVRRSRRVKEKRDKAEAQRARVAEAVEANVKNAMAGGTRCR